MTCPHPCNSWLSGTHLQPARGTPATLLQHADPTAYDQIAVISPHRHHVIMHRMLRGKNPHWPSTRCLCIVPAHNSACLCCILYHITVTNFAGCCLVQAGEVKQKLAAAEKDLEAAQAEASKQTDAGSEVAQLKQELKDLQVHCSSITCPCFQLR